MPSPRTNRRPPAVVTRVTRAVALCLVLGACARGAMVTNSPSSMSPTPPSPDPRVGLKAGLHDAGEAS